MKILTIVGARPQFIKAASGSRALRKQHQEILVHTGQHHDENMSEVFFREMEIPTPDYNLGIAGGSHGEMTGRMLIEIEKVLQKEVPDAVLLYGDTNSTLAGALAAVKLHIPVIHVEAGNRLGTLDNPEEVNRICTDHCSTLLLCATEDARQKLEKENLGDRAHVIGNVMYDSFLHFAGRPWTNPHIIGLDGKPVTVPEELAELKPKLFTAGETITLKGNRANEFVRARAVNSPDVASNNKRIARQKAYAVAFVNQLKQGMKEDMTLPVKLYQTAEKQMVTSLSLDQAVYLCTEYMNCSFDTDNIYTIDGAVTMGEKYAEFNVDDDALYQLILDVFYEEVN